MATVNRQRLAVYSAGFWRQHHHRRILALAGWQVAPFASPFGADAVGIWGRKPASLRGRAAASFARAPLLTVEDAFLRAVQPGRTSACPVGLILDRRGIYFDASGPSDLENILNDGGAGDSELLARARAGREKLIADGLSKYNPAPQGRGPLPKAGYVLVVDQRRGDASIAAGQATRETFWQMLNAAIAENPDREVIVRSHPHGQTGHFGRLSDRQGVRLLREPTNPWDMLAGAHSVYCVTSQLGFEAILNGHRPHVFGLPFYAGWGLSEDRQHCDRRVRTLNVDALFAGVMLRYPTWYDPLRDELCEFERAAEIFAAHVKQAWENAPPAVCTGFSNWKRRHMRQFLQGGAVPPVFRTGTARALRAAGRSGGRIFVWASREPPDIAARAQAKNIPVIRVEDGFLRSAGLGADLIPPRSLVFDDIGVHYDPSKASRLEGLISQAAGLPPGALKRAARLRDSIVESGVSKYNLSPRVAVEIEAAGRQVVLVAGQVEDDASVLRAAPGLGGNRGLLKAARTACPDAFIIFKPHPDVEAGLRPGRLDDDAAQLADHLAGPAGVTALIDAADEVWTLSSLLGFEALLRGRRVVCLGMPFYAGWGLTDDRGQPCARRTAKPSLNALVHAALIEYPVYLDHKTGLFVTPEQTVDLLSGRTPEGLGTAARAQRLLGKSIPRPRKAAIRT